MPGQDRISADEDQKNLFFDFEPLMNDVGPLTAICAIKVISSMIGDNTSDEITAHFITHIASDRGAERELKYKLPPLAGKTDHRIELGCDDATGVHHKRSTSIQTAANIQELVDVKGIEDLSLQGLELSQIGFERIKLSWEKVPEAVAYVLFRREWAMPAYRQFPGEIASDRATAAPNFGREIAYNQTDYIVLLPPQNSEEPEEAETMSLTLAGRIAESCGLLRKKA